MVGEPSALGKAVGNLFPGGPANVSWERALEGLGAEDAGRVPPGLPHSVAQIVAHVAFWQDFLLEEAGGGAPVRPEHAVGGWPQPGPWEEWRARLLAGQARLRSLARDPAFPASPTREGHPWAATLANFAGHGLYHLGQVVTLRRVLGSAAFRGSPALVVEFVEGEPPRELREADTAELGRRVARVHARAPESCGDPAGRIRFPLADFYPRALNVVREVASRFDPDAWAPHWPEVEAAFTSAPSPTRAVPMLLDPAGSQFVWREGQPFALVDVEASALAPPELDLCLWELLLTPEGARGFQVGYTERLPFPDLGPHRAACRLILRALEVEGSPPLREWLSLPPLFSLTAES